MVTQFKKALYISTSILFTNIFILNSNAETNTATDIMSGIANIANSFSTTINQQENDLAEEQTTQKTDVNTNTSEQNQENATSEAPDNINTDSETEDSVIKQTIDSSNTVISDQNNDPNLTDIPTTSTAKIGFIDQNGNVLIAPKETVFPSEMKDGELYYFSRDVEKAKENIKNNITPNENGQQPIPSTPSTNGDAVPGQLPQQNNIPQTQNPAIPNENGQQPIPSTPPTNSDVVPSQLPQQNNIPQTQPAIPNENGQQPIPSIPSTNGDVVPGQLPPQNPIPQPQNPTVPNENGQQTIPSIPSTNGDVVPGQLPQQNPDIQPTKTPGIPASFDMDKTGKKPIMFQCYLA